jgi:large subunit ribosomal protein L41
MQPTAPLFRSIRRLALTTKQAGHNYYKGNRTGSMGRHTKWGGYVVDYKKVRTYVCPDLAGFNVRLYIQKDFGQSRERVLTLGFSRTVDAFRREAH